MSGPSGKIVWTGTLRRRPDGSYGGELRDTWGWTVVLNAVVKEGPSGRYFELEGSLSGQVPAAARVPILDDEPPAVG